MKNKYAKTRPINNPYEVWRNPRLPGWTWNVLKKWQIDDNKPNARWFCNVISPICPGGELGDVYVKDIKDLGATLQCVQAKQYIKNNKKHN
jgi:hypothetical protein